MFSDTPSLSPIRVMLVDDHRTILWGLSRLIESARPAMDLVATATSRCELLQAAVTYQPDIILLDLDLAGDSGADAIADIERICPAKVLILTGTHDIAVHQDAIIKGAKGVVCKEEDAEVILRAIERVYAGEVWINRQLMGAVITAMSGGAASAKRNPAADKIVSLTERERSIIKAIVINRGAKGNTIAETLHISEHTLRNHLTVIYDKLGVRNRIDLYAFAVDHGLGIR